MSNKETFKAKTVYYYYRVYKHFLLENNLPDDSSDIEVDELMSYVQNHIPVDDKTRLMAFCLEAY